MWIREALKDDDGKHAANGTGVEEQHDPFTRSQRGPGA
jgi:hypothetical protein